MEFKIYHRVIDENTYEKVFEAGFSNMFDVVDFISSTYSVEESTSLEVVLFQEAYHTDTYICNGAALHKDRA